MTQKELLYYEDAVGHEENIIKILNNSIQNVDSEEIKNFLESEVEIHKTIKNNLMGILEAKTNA